MDTVIKQLEKSVFVLTALKIFFIFGADCEDQPLKCIENGRFYRNPPSYSSDSDFLWSSEECSKYFLCLEGEVFEFRCTSGLFFNVDKQICELKEKVENCDRTTENDKSPTPDSNNSCENSKFQKCKDNTTCIPAEYFCDGSIDCPDSSDENLCDANGIPNQAPSCYPNNCKLPKCFCSKDGTDIPGNLKTPEVPQMVLITFEDAINDENIEFYNSIFSERYANPNGCPISATFFASHMYNNYYFTQKLWNQGHEIAVHSITHRDPEEWWSNNATVEDWFDEMVGQANILNKFSSIRLADVKGLRVPYLRIGWNRQYLMMNEFGFLYDSSIVAPYSHTPLWPYTFDYKMPHKCFRQMCPTRAYPGLWEIVINQLEASEISCATLDSCPSDLSGQEIFETLMRNFNRHYSTNRAPFGIHLQSSWFENADYLTAFQDFIDYALSRPNVWFITNSQAIEWMQHPVPVHKLSTFRSWDCTKKLKQPQDIACQEPNTCHLFSRPLKEDIEFQTCKECPRKYPWVKNEFGMD